MKFFLHYMLATWVARTRSRWMEAYRLMLDTSDSPYRCATGAEALAEANAEADWIDAVDVARIAYDQYQEAGEALRGAEIAYMHACGSYLVHLWSELAGYES